MQKTAPTFLTSLSIFLLAVLFSTRGAFATDDSGTVTAGSDSKTFQLQYLNTLTFMLAQPEKSLDWDKTYQAALALRPVQTPEVNAMFLKILERTAPITLLPDSTIPHAMAPLHMMQSVAIQNLSASGNRNYLPVLNRLAAVSPERIIRAMAEDYIQKLEPTPTPDLEPTRR